MNKFCEECGSKLDRKGRCPNCGAGFAPKKGQKADKKDGSGKKRKPWLAALLIAILAFVLAVVVIEALQYFGVINIPAAGKLLETVGISREKTVEKRDEPTEIEDIPVENPDAEAVLSQYGSINGTIPAQSSSAIQSERDVLALLASKGFTQEPITTCYDMNGNYIGETEISGDSDEKHPFYETNYTTADGMLWRITAINGRIFANPVSYNFGGYWSTPHIVGETASFLNYDSVTNQFYEITPDEAGMKIKLVPQINAQTLEEMPWWEVDE